MAIGAVAISGARGLVGSALVKALGGVRVLRLARPGSPDGGGLPWDPAADSFDAAGLEECDAVVHLAGEPIASGRWSAARKERILRSRVDGTKLLVEGLSRLSRRPGVLVSASAIGYYGDRGDEELAEASPPGEDFLARVARGWEAEAARAASLGVRVVILRLGIVLAREGGALAKMLTPFRLGLGGPLGSGRQWMSWIHIDDLVDIIKMATRQEGLAGPVNAVAPEPVRNAEFTRALGKTLRRPALLPAPAFALRAALGEMAGALLLSSQRVVPRRLLELGFAYRFPRLEEALHDLVARR